MAELASCSNRYVSFRELEISEFVENFAKLFSILITSDTTLFRILIDAIPSQNDSLLNLLWKSFIFCSNAAMRYAGFKFLHNMCSKIESGSHFAIDSCIVKAG